MARSCAITGKSSQVGGRYSNRTRATQFNPTGKVRRKANLQKRRIFVPELNETIMLDISVKGLRHIKKNGAHATLKKAGIISYVKVAQSKKVEVAA
jgi:ribosomal protein L28